MQSLGGLVLFVALIVFVLFFFGARLRGVLHSKFFHSKSFLKISLLNISSYTASLAIIYILLYASLIIPAFNLNFYAKEYDKYSIAESIEMDMDDLMLVTSHMVDYIKDRNDDLNIETRVGGEKRNFFSQREIDHMIDVKELFILAGAIRNAACFILLTALIFIFVKKEAALRLLAKTNIKSVAMLALILVVLVFIFFIDFDTAFNVFHEIFFTNDLWQLDPNVDLLINIVPLQFFMDIAGRIAAIFASFLAILTLMSLIYLKTYNNRKA